MNCSSEGQSSRRVQWTGHSQLRSILLLTSRLSKHSRALLAGRGEQGKSGREDGLRDDVGGGPH